MPRDGSYDDLAAEAAEHLDGLEDCDAWRVQTTVHGADVGIRYDGRCLPAGLLEALSEYGDLYIEGVRNGYVEATLQL